MIKKSACAILFQSIGAFLWGCFIVTAPIYEVLYGMAIIWVPIFLWREYIRIKKYGFFPGILVKIFVISTTIIVSSVAPFKYEDREVSVFPKENYTIRELHEALSAQDISISYHDTISEYMIEVPKKSMTLKNFVSYVNSQKDSNVFAHFGGRCGTGATILWGYPRIGGLKFRVRPKRSQEPHSKSLEAN